ncbi:MAG TPA: hypothetical protein VL651_08975 [Bacteroidia bacterium]|nr:hypothetical protein [Bacteroidia bacterium]
MKRTLFAVSPILLAFVLGISCTHKEILPEEQVSFVEHVQPILRSSCQSSGCHVVGGSGEADQMDTYDDVMRHERVVAGNPHASEIYKRITASGGEERMPRAPYGKLSDLDISYIYVWIAQGAKNN